MEATYNSTKNYFHLESIDSWRIYFKAITLSDICDGQGKKVIVPYRESKKLNIMTNTELENFTSQNWNNLNNTTFKIWKKFLQQMLGLQRNSVTTTK